MSITPIAFLILTIALAGCTSAAKAVRPSVVLILDHVDAYERALDARIAAEQKYYAGHAATLDRAARQATLIARDIRQRELVFAYADAARPDGPKLRLSRLMQFLANADDEFNRALIEYIKLAGEGRAAANSAFASLETKRETLAAIRTALQEILQGEDLTTRARFWGEYLNRVNDEFKRLKEEQEKKLKGQPATAPTKP
ncbi:MAG: hypothetical protein HY725_22365 [Candidatus Rokubacteria bacterium]|nr:hypothetical protein [Candidatus Rokubacteria bacterium]